MSAVKAKIYSTSQAEFGRVVSRELHLAVDNTRCPVKEVARLADVPVPSAKNWLAVPPRAVPQALHLERLRAAFPNLDAAIRRLHAVDAVDPEAQRLATELVQHIMRAR